MAIDDADDAGPDATEESDEPGATSLGTADDEPAVRGSYAWADFAADHGYHDDASKLRSEDDDGRDWDGDVDWDRIEFDPTLYVDFHPTDAEEYLREVAGPPAKGAREVFEEYVDPETTPVVKDVWTWEHFKWKYYYDEDGRRPRDDEGEIERFDPTDYLSFEPDNVEENLAAGESAAEALSELVDERTVDVNEEVDEDAFFSTPEGHTTVVNRYDLEKAVPMEKKRHFREVERYWVNKPYAFVMIFHSRKENEKKYYLVEPYLDEIEADLREFLAGKLRTAIKYGDGEVAASGSPEERRGVIDRETRRLLDRYDLFEPPSDGGGLFGGGSLGPLLGDGSGLGDRLGGAGLTDRLGGGGLAGRFDGGLGDRVGSFLGGEDDEEDGGLDGIAARPEPAVIAEDPDTLTEYQVEKLLYLLKRDFIGYERIDGIKHDINVEDVSCDGYNSPVFVYHTDYEQIITNVYHGEDELDDFVIKLAQRSGKGISKRRPQVDATLPDGSRAQLTLGREVSDHGTNYTIRQFKDVPFTPVDLINWRTFSLEQMALLWLCIENNKSLIFAGGTASGKTTSLNAVSLFIPSNTKIVSIEDTREVELPQRNWVASVTRPSFAEDGVGDIDEFDLLEAALRQRPDYIVMGEVRGEEGRTLFQVMSTGHTTYTTFHADSVGEVLKRFTTDPINVSKTMFTALDLVSIQTQTRVDGRKVRRNKVLTEVNHYDAENDEINVRDVYQWQAESDEFYRIGDSNTLSEIKFDRGWSQERLEEELFKREVILAYLIRNGLSGYTEVAATIQAFINDPDTILTLIANGDLEESLQDLREMESVHIQVDPEKEALVPRPDPGEEEYELAGEILEEAERTLLEDYRGRSPDGLETALADAATDDAGEVPVVPTDDDWPSDENPGDESTGPGDPDQDADAGTPADSAERAPDESNDLGPIETSDEAPSPEDDADIDGIADDRTDESPVEEWSTNGEEGDGVWADDGAGGDEAADGPTEGAAGDSGEWSPDGEDADDDPWKKAREALETSTENNAEDAEADGFGDDSGDLSEIDDGEGADEWFEGTDGDADEEWFDGTGDGTDGEEPAGDEGG